MNYKEEIIQTRKGCVGSSDGHMLSQIASLGYVPKSCYKRMAILKGFEENKEISSATIRAGNDLEMMVYNHLVSKDARYESNPLWVSKNYSRRNVKLISHPDLVLKDEEKKTIFVYEVKTTKFSVAQTRATYKEQLYIHYVLGKELAKELGDKWKVKLFLVHYDTNGLDLKDGVEFEPERLTVSAVNQSTTTFDIKLAMDIVDAFLDSFTEYYGGDEVDANLLPENVKGQFNEVARALIEIKEREAQVEDFKKRLFAFMSERNIKSIKNDVFVVSRVDETESKTFDHKRFIDELKSAHPIKAKKLLRKYEKVTKRSGYALIKIKK